MNRIYLALGSNLGDRAAYIERGVAALDSQDLRIRRVSPVYETAPQEVFDQGWFLNLVIEADTTLEPGQLLARCQEIEQLLDRERATDKGPRTLDIDILFFNEEVIDTPGLQIPHASYRERNFVLQPLADLAPDLCDPITRSTVSEMLREVSSQPVRRTNITVKLP